MSVHASIFLTKDVSDLDKADDWFAEIKELLQGHTECKMHMKSSNSETPIDITREQESE